MVNDSKRAANKIMRERGERNINDLLYGGGGGGGE